VSLSGGQAEKGWAAGPAVGLVVDGANAAAALNEIVRAEREGVQQVWMTQPGRGAADAIGCLTAAAARTTSIQLGTAITPIYGRHPVALAQQVLAIGDIAPGRFRLGIGTSHKAIVEDAHGVPRHEPLAYLEEYITVLRDLIWTGEARHQGAYFDVDTSLPRASRVPILTAALSLKGFEVGGRIADGVLSWACPIRYLRGSAAMAMAAAAEVARRPRPRLVAHVPVALHGDAERARVAAKAMFRRHANMPAYARMFRDAGFTFSATEPIPEGLIDDVVVIGAAPDVIERLLALLGSGIDELMLTPLVVADAAAETRQLRQVAASVSTRSATADIGRGGTPMRYSA
jgi:F420-dependent oxidoreductase-like protein